MNDMTKPAAPAQDAGLLERVERLQTDYVNTIDDERYRELPDFFTERGSYRIVSKENHQRGRPFGLVFCDSRAMLRDRIVSMYKANIFEPHTYRHVTGRSTIVRAADGLIEARTSYIVARIMHDGGQELFSTGIYLDRICEEDGKLLFSEKVVVTDASRVDALLVIPL
ncbi:nuclear transport factor 2 family protein [Lacisediminimonas sp.]|uniref:aromatic-ring-hydroxylating dioxygenase subunit beta n=1 Tax=Lacisediminimonas sp. TaxID=3060582 RepID=UPI002727D524|nr:nuclear transport factor 2 family protein [Lacisediminimonas sp.]MDO8301107.1 nuclear transport factor 2 family protein [Lacisediminimonas sp.]